MCLLRECLCTAIAVHSSTALNTIPATPAATPTIIVVVGAGPDCDCAAANDSDDDVAAAAGVAPARMETVTTLAGGGHAPGVTLDAAHAADRVAYIIAFIATGSANVPVMRAATASAVPTALVLIASTNVALSTLASCNKCRAADAASRRRRRRRRVAHTGAYIASVMVTLNCPRRTLLTSSRDTCTADDECT